MKHLLALSLLLLSLITNAQKFTIYVDNGQQFEHDSTLSTTDAILLNKITYLTAGSTQLTYTFDFENMVMIREFKGHEPTVKKMEKNYKSKNPIDVFVYYEDGVRNYTLLEISSKFVFISRTYESDKITGWFDKDVEMKKRP